MKHKTFKSGNHFCKTYLRPEGHAFEVGFQHGKKTLFVGSFVRQADANLWYNVMNREVRKIGRRFKVGANWPTTWFEHLVTSTLRRQYANLQTRFATRDAREATRTEKKCVRQYRKLTRRWESRGRRPLLRAA